MERQGSYCRLVADVENHIVVDLQAVVEPHDLRDGQRRVAFAQHEQLTARTLLQVCRIEVLTTRVGKLQCSFVVPVDVGEVSAVRVDVGLVQ